MKRQLIYFLGLLSLAFSCRPGSPENIATTGETWTEPSWALLPFEKADSANPVLEAMGDLQFICPIRKTALRWAEKDVFNPAALVRGDTLWMIFRAEDRIGKYAGTSRLGLAYSLDGLKFNPLPEPVFYPDEDSLKIYEWEGGCEDPRVVETADGRYIMTYTAYDGKTARLLVASSPDLRRWEKHGLAFKQGKYRDWWSKSGAIVGRRQGDRLVAEKIDGKYWMYWGDKNIHLAYSENLIDWTPLLQGDTLQIVLPFRPDKFDSDLVEPGPPAMITDQGILLIYNSRNYGPRRDTSIAAGTYSAGQALFAPDQPGQLLQRSERAFFWPQADYEVFGQVNRVVFLEGLAPYRDKWFLYYGTADSKIAAAVKEEK